MSKKIHQSILGYSLVTLAFAAVVSYIFYLQLFSPSDLLLPIHKEQKTLNYLNSEYGFQVDYAKSYSLSLTGDQENFFRTKGQTLADIALPQGLYPGTNFGLAHATISVRSKTSSDDCAYYLTGANQSTQITTTVNVAGNRAYFAAFNGAAAGTEYDNKLYRISHNGNCYELNLTVGIANIGNYTPGAVTEVNANDVWQKLDAIVQSFKFTK